MKNAEVRGSQTRQAIDDAEYELIERRGNEVVLRDTELDRYELWTQNDGFAGYVVVIDGIGHEFVTSDLRRVQAPLLANAGS